MKRFGVAGVVVLAVAMVGAGCATVIEATVPYVGNTSGTGAVNYGNGGPTISGDGRYVVYTGPRNPTGSDFEVYRHDNQTGATELVSRGADGTPAGGSSVAMSSTGRYVAFITRAALVANDTNADQGFGNDVYVRDMETGTVTRVSIQPDGRQFASEFYGLISGAIFISDDARYIAFGNLHYAGRTFTNDVYVRDRTAGQTALAVSGYLTVGGLSGDGLHLGIDPHDTCSNCPTYAQGYVLHWQTKATYPLGVCAAGGVMGLSTTGRYIAVEEGTAIAGPTCHGGIHRFDRTAGTSIDVSLPPGGVIDTGSFPSITADGRRVAFSSIHAYSGQDSNAVGDVYVKDLTTGELGLVSANTGNAVGDRDSRLPWISADGAYVVVTTDATNLVSGDTDGATDVFTISATRPTITSMSPVSAARSATGVVVTVSGSGFLPGATAFIGGSGVTVTAVNVVDSQLVKLTLSVSGSAALGTRDVTIVDPGAYGSSSGWCFGCLTVT